MLKRNCFIHGSFFILLFISIFYWILLIRKICTNIHSMIIIKPNRMHNLDLIGFIFKINYSHLINNLRFSKIFFPFSIYRNPKSFNLFTIVLWILCFSLLVKKRGYMDWRDRKLDLKNYVVILPIFTSDFPFFRKWNKSIIYLCTCNLCYFFLKNCEDINWGKAMFWELFNSLNEFRI